MKPVSMKFVALAVASLLAASVAGPAVAAPIPTASTETVSVVPYAGADATDHRSVQVTFPADHTLDVDQDAWVYLSVDTSQPTTARFQQNVDGAWTDLETVEVTTGGFDDVFPVPDHTPGTVTIRVVLDADAVFPAWTSPEQTYTVTDPSVPPVVKTPSTITLTRPAVSTVQVGKRVAVTGTVGGLTPARRTVRLELDTKRGPMGVATATTDANGAYSIKVPTDWYYTGTLHARVLATDTDAAAVSDKTFTMTVRPDYTPGGHANQWHVMSGGEGYRWNPCGGTITYQVNLTGAPRNALAQVKQAFAKVHAATGLTFAYDGETTAIPYRTDGKGRKSSSADFTLAFASDRQVRDLSGWTIGLGGWLNGSNGEIFEGGVVLDRSAHLKPGFAKGATWGSLLLHEIGHAMNLDHAEEKNEVMHSGLGDYSPGHYQAGDLTGLAKMGAMGGCLDGDTIPARPRTPTWHVAS